MSVCSIEFLSAILLLTSVFFFLPRRWQRQGVYILCNLGFLSLFLNSRISWIALFSFLLSGFFIAKILKRFPNKIIFSGYILILIGTFLILKKYEILSLILPKSWLKHNIAIVGLSYMLFRQIHFIVDIMQEQIDRFPLWFYINYQINFLTLLAGPIQRFQDFSAYWSQMDPCVRDKHEIYRQYYRIFLGIFKIAVIAALFMALYSKSAIKPKSTHILFKHICRFYAYPAYVYFNFAGYCDIVIGAAALLGLVLPENFNKPYLARNMIDFWNRWHITLGYWIRDYLFTPLYKFIAVHWAQYAQSLAFLCYFIALFLAGIWHGTTLNFVFFGFLHGIGVSAAKLWELLIVKRKKRSGFRKYMKNKWIRRSAVLLNFHYACFTFIFFPTQSSELCRKILSWMF